MSAPTTTPRISGFDRWFEVTKRGSSYGREIRGGFVTFFTMAYIVVLNPLIIGTAKDINGLFVGGTDDVVKAITMVTAATALIAGLMTMLMGAVGRFPIAIAAGLGLNGYVAFTLAPQMTWADAMGLVVLEGILITILVLTGFRTAVFHAVPEQLKYAIGVGIGLFIALIGLVDAGIVRPGIPLISFGVFGELQGWPIFTCVFESLISANDCVSLPVPGRRIFCASSVPLIWGSLNGSLETSHTVLFEDLFFVPISRHLASGSAH